MYNTISLALFLAFAGYVAHLAFGLYGQDDSLEVSVPLADLQLDVDEISKEVLELKSKLNALALAKGFGQ